MLVTNHRSRSINRCVHSNKYEDEEECSNRWMWPKNKIEKCSNFLFLFSFTCGESNGYWSVNLNCNWNFSPSYNVPGAPSMSIRILFDWKNVNSNEKFLLNLPTHIRTVVDDASKTIVEKMKKTTFWQTYIPGVGFSVKSFNSFVRRFRTKSNWKRKSKTQNWIFNREKSMTYGHDVNFFVEIRSNQSFHLENSRVFFIDSDHSFVFFWKKNEFIINTKTREKDKH